MTESCRICQLSVPEIYFTLIWVTKFCRIVQLSIFHCSQPTVYQPAKIASPVCFWDFSTEPSSPSLMPFNKSEWWWLVGLGMGRGWGGGMGMGGWVGGWAVDYGHTTLLSQIKGDNHGLATTSPFPVCGHCPTGQPVLGKSAAPDSALITTIQLSVCCWWLGPNVPPWVHVWCMTGLWHVQQPFPSQSVGKLPPGQARAQLISSSLAIAARPSLTSLKSL